MTAVWGSGIATQAPIFISASVVPQVNQKELTYVPPAQKEAQAGVRAALGPAYEQARWQAAHGSIRRSMC